MRGKLHSLQAMFYRNLCNHFPTLLQVYSYGLDVQQVQRTIKKLRQRDSVELISHLPVSTCVRRGPLLDAPAWTDAEAHQHSLPAVPGHAAWHRPHWAQGRACPAAAPCAPVVSISTPWHLSQRHVAVLPEAAAPSVCCTSGHKSCSFREAESSGLRQRIPVRPHCLCCCSFCSAIAPAGALQPPLKVSPNPPCAAAGL